MEGYLPDNIGDMSSLTSFTVGYNYVFGTIPTSIGQWTQISYMNFFGNYLTGTIPSVISSLKTLTDLELDQNYMNGTIPSFIFELTKLQVLHLYDNSFSGTIPSNIGNLQMLTRLTLDTNGLMGTIPESIATMRRLQYLHLFSNQLDGTIPNSISTLTELYDISIYDNYFTGTLPYLADLTDLFILDVHNNYLTMGGLSELPESDFSWLTIQGPMDLSGNCLTLVSKGFVATGCQPSNTPTSGEHHVISCSTLPFTHVTCRHLQWPRPSSNARTQDPLFLHVLHINFYRLTLTLFISPPPFYPPSLAVVTLPLSSFHCRPKWTILPAHTGANRTHIPAHTNANRTFLPANTDANTLHPAYQYAHMDPRESHYHPLTGSSFLPFRPSLSLFFPSQ
jgi:Leucine rich repeat